MLPKKNRLSNSNHIEDIKKNSKKITTPLFTLLVNKSQDNLEFISKFAFVISAKISKKAVVRNKKRRQFSHAVKEYLSQFPTGEYIFIIHKKAVNADYNKIKTEIKNVIKRI